MYTYDVGSLKESQHFQQNNNIFLTFRGIFFVMILFCSSFLSPYLGCNYQYIIQLNPNIGYLILFFIIYFSINIVDTQSKLIENPIYDIIRSLCILFGFILLNNMHTNYIIIVLLFFAGLVLTSKYYSYFKQPSLQVEKNQKPILDILYVIQIALVIFILTLIGISFIIYDNKQTSLRLNKCNIQKS